MATRIGVDVGGTFTDLVFYDEETGALHVGKGPSVSDRPDEGVLGVVSEFVSEDALIRAAYFLHGTTVGINALLERNGARVGLLTTDGFRDVLQMRRGSRGDALYDLHYQPKPPLVPRHLRFGIGERILADGAVERSLDPEDVRRAFEQLRDENIDGLAVCFINAYANPQHELEAEKLLRDCGFDGPITLSHRVSREFREFERTSTSVVDAYVRPAVSSYLRRLDDALHDKGFSGESLITRSGGGSLSFAEAEDRPFETVMSGPVAGAVGAGALSRTLGFSRAITADVGGTSFDTCLLVDGAPLVKYEGQVGDVPLQSQWVDVRSIGSGGGSIAYVDASSLLRVGPESAGAMPGPVCYGRGGVRPTTTDAAAVLGMLGFGELAGGLRLDIPKAEQAITELGKQLNLSTDEAASGVVRIAGAAMAGAVRSVTIEQGEDPREAALMAYGGAGPMLATIIATELGITSIVVPEHAGNFSARSLLSQDIVRAASLTSISLLDQAALAAAHETADRLRRELEERSENRVAADNRTFEVALDLRYVGQLHTLAITWPEPAVDSDPTAVKKAFEAQYEKVFGHTYEGPVEIVAVRVSLRDTLPDFKIRAADTGVAPAEDRHCDAYSFDLGRRVEFVVRDRAVLTDEPCDGPMIVVEPTTTIYVDAGWTAQVKSQSALILKRKSEM